MKATYSALVLAAVTFSAAAQKVENDDMYFTAKDRAQLKSERIVVDRSPSVAKQEMKSTVAQPQQLADGTVNPTDSYSARNVNPEYSANNTKQNSSKSDYFVEDYRPTGVNGNLNGNYSSKGSSNSSSYYYNNPYAYNPYSTYGNMGWGYPMGGMYPSMSYGMGMGYGMGGFGYPYSPFYGYGSRMSLIYGMSFGYPSMYNSMAMGYGYGGYYSPYMGTYGMYDPFMMSGFYNPYSFYGYASPYSSYYYPGTVVVDNSHVSGRNVAHTKRSDRSMSEQYQPDGTRQAVTQSRTGRALSSAGRTRSADGTQAYYERGWRNSMANDGTRSASTSRSAWSQGSTNPSTTSSGRYDNSGRTSSSGSSWSSWDNHNSGNSGSSWNTGGNSRSSWNTGTSTMHSGSMGGGSRSSMGGGGGSTGGGHSRGRD